MKGRGQPHWASECSWELVGEVCEGGGRWGRVGGRLGYSRLLLAEVLRALRAAERSGEAFFLPVFA